MRWILVAVATASLLLAASSVPAFSADNGTVNASVTAATPCITLSIPPLQFGTLPFNTTTTPSGVLNNPGTFSNCSAQSEKILLRGTDASGAGAAWTLGNPATCTIDVFASRLQIPGVSYAVSKTDQEIQTAAPSSTTAIDSISLTMPCTGSSGAGTTMSWQYIFTATF